MQDPANPVPSIVLPGNGSTDTSPRVNKQALSPTEIQRICRAFIRLITAPEVHYDNPAGLLRRCAIYARVSSAKQEQEGNLLGQVERLRAVADRRGYQIVAVISEQTSSLNEKRKGMKKLLALIDQQAIDIVLIGYPDRLVRFGFGYLEEMFGWKQVRLEVVESPKVQTPTEELVQDLLTIVTVFSGRLYGSRAKRVRKSRVSVFES